MRSSFFPALLLAGCACAYANSIPRQPIGPAVVSPLQSIGVFLDFENHPSANIIQFMEREISSIMRPASLVFAWRDISGSQDAGSSPGSFPDLVVIKFKGSCESALSMPAPGQGDRALASTRTSNGQVLHFTEVHCDEVRRYLAADVVRMNEKARDQVYGRALGRILAHEMYHVFANTEKHADGGIARACYSRQDLTQSVFEFAPKETEMLRNYAARALLTREATAEP